MSYNKSNGSNTYRQQQILTASPARLVAMLYEKAITFLKLAIKAIEAGDIQARHNANARAIEIIEHLSMTLDTEKGGNIASNLERLYPFMIQHLINVDVHNDPQPAREVITLMEPLYESWCVLDRQMAQGILTAPPASSPVTPMKPVAAPDATAPALETPLGGHITATA